MARVKKTEDIVMLTDIVKQIKSNLLEELNYKVAEDAIRVILREFFNVVVESLKQEKTVDIVKFGKFYTYKRSSRVFENRYKAVDLPEMTCVRFKCNTGLKSQVKYNYTDPMFSHQWYIDSLLDPKRARLKNLE